MAQDASTRQPQALSELVDRLHELDPDRREEVVRDLETTDPNLADAARRVLSGFEPSAAGTESGLDAASPAESPKPAAGGRLGARLGPGSKLGRYEIGELLGAGGMGEVFRAFDPRLAREVAIKVISRILAKHPEALERFEGEARAASALNHPNIITIHDLGEEEGSPFIVMELVEGQSLRELAATPLPVERLLRLGTQLAAGLAAAHARGVVHRDLKPANVVVDARDTPRIADFGTARLIADEVGEGEAGAERGEHSAAEAVQGTIGYIAPEMLRGEATDHRADQFALGAILFELASGESPFRRATMEESVEATRHEEPDSLRERRPDLPAGLVAIVHRCMSKAPEDRYESTADLHRALSALKLPAETRAQPDGLPTPSTELVGRADEVERVRALLCGGVRLLTLAGVGGTGKTRLAIEVARGLTHAFPGGVVFVPLAAIDDPELVLATIARVQGGADAGGSESLSERLRSLTASAGRVLLVLDNFEHVSGAAPELGSLLEACPDLSILVTSRELLHLSGERPFPIRPLALPPEEPVPVDELCEVPAVAFFVERVRAADPDYTLRAEDTPAVAAICRRLDGLPLALELAAARMRLMSPQALLRRLQSLLETLSAGPRDLPARQRTLRAAMDWSYELLDPVEQAVFRRLGIFVGGFTLEAAEAVVDPFGRLERDVAETVESLLGHSLIVREAAAGGEPRVSMLETVREYAAERMQAEENVAALRKAHAAYYMILAGEGDSAAEASAERLQMFSREQGNFRAALHWAQSEDQAEWGLRLANGLFHVWNRGEGLAEGRRHFADLLALPSAQPVTDLRARSLLSAGILASHQGEPEVASDYTRRALEAYRALGNASGEAVTLNALGVFHTETAAYAEAQGFLETCLELWEQLGESSNVARTLANIGYVLRQRQELAKARQLYRDAAAMFRRLGDDVGAAFEVSHEADVARDQGDPEAESLYRRALDAFRDLGAPWGEASVLVDLAEVAEVEERYDDSVVHYRAALSRFQELGHLRGIARVLEGWTVVATKRGEDERALYLGGAASALRRRAGEELTHRPERAQELKSALSSARRRLDETTARRTWRQGERAAVAPLVDDLLARST